METINFNIFGAAFCVVQQSGKYNTLTEFDSVYTASLCIIGYAWGNSECVNYILSNKLRSRLFDEYPLKHKLWLNIAKSSPNGENYLEKYSLYHTKTNPIMEYMKNQDISCYLALVVISEKMCFRKGELARDEYRLNSLKGIFNENTIKQAGAQLINI